MPLDASASARVPRGTIVSALVVLLLASSLSAAASGPRGIVIDSLGGGSPLIEAGLVAGDLLFAWERDAGLGNPHPARGDFATPFDALLAEVEQANRGPFRIVTSRGTLPLVPGEWKLDSSPAERAAPGGGRAEAELAAWRAAQAGRSHADAGRPTEAESAFAEARARAERLTPFVRVQILSLRAEAWVRQKELPKAAEVYREALAICDAEIPDSLTAAWIATRFGFVHLDSGDLAGAEALFRRALATRERQAPESLDVATSLNHLGIVADDRGDPAAGQELYEHALAIQERLVPGGLPSSKTLVNLGFAARARGDLAAAESFLVRALAIQERLGSSSAAMSLSNLGELFHLRGDFAAAERHWRRSLAMVEESAPEGRSVALRLGNLASLAIDRGDLVGAEELLLRRFAIEEKLSPDSRDTAYALHSLGILEWKRGDSAAAERYFRRALQVREKVAPDGLEVGETWNAIGQVVAENGEHQAAMGLHRRALALYERVASESPEIARTHFRIARVAEASGQPTLAQAEYEVALRMEERLAPRGLEVAAMAHAYGKLLASTGRREEGRRELDRALELRGKLAAGTAEEAETLSVLARLDREKGELGHAAERYRLAVEALEAQSTRLGGSLESQAGFAARSVEPYRESIDLLVELGRTGEAIHLLERSRARGLLVLLGERDLVLEGEVPAELERERRLVDREYESVLRDLAGLSAVADAAAIERLDARRRELRGRQARIAEQIRRESPRRGRLQYPAPLDLVGIRATLDRGTVLLAYSVGESRSLLFVISAESVRPQVFVLAVSEAALREKVEAFRARISRRGSGRAAEAALAEAGGDLYATLVEPAERALAKAERLVIVPDGPLHALPFSALSRRREPLVAWKPLHTVVSMTVYAELAGARRSRGEPPWVRPGEVEAAPSTATLVAFGDPSYPAARSGQGLPAGAVASPLLARDLAALVPLPATRIEVERLAALYGPAAAAFVGDEVTEERVRELAPGARIVHFATHGLLDERFPLDSALALTIPERPAEAQENGLLQAWEILERLRLDADLVTLSACETALGREAGGEGLIGLTRAFQYAGARSILASLWSVADASTATLMGRFYGYLRTGRTKDESLRRAQLDLLRDPATAHPFHWAAFELIGDWR